MLWDWACRIVGLFSLLMAAMLIMRGILAARASGFKFYLAIRLIGSSVLVVPSWSLIMIEVDGADSGVSLMMLIMLIVSTMQVLEERWQNKARTAFPVQWTVWESEAKHARPLKRFFYPRITQQKRPNSNSDSDARSNKVFLTSMIFMAVAGLIGLVLILLILLSRRGL